MASALSPLILYSLKLNFQSFLSWLIQEYSWWFHKCLHTLNLFNFECWEFSNYIVQNTCFSQVKHFQSSVYNRGIWRLFANIRKCEGLHAGKHMKAASWYLFLLKWPKFWPESFWGWKWNQQRDVQGGMFLWTCSRAFVFRLIDVWRSFQMEVFSMKRIWRDGYSVAGGRLYIIGLGAAFRPLNEAMVMFFPWVGPTPFCLPLGK